MTREQILWSALLVSLSATPAAAQTVEVTLSGGRVNDARGAERAGVSISPLIGWTDGLSSVSVGGSATVLDGGDRLWSAGLSTRLELVRVGLASVDLVGGGRAMTSEELSGGSARVSPRLSAVGLGWRTSAGPVWGAVRESSLTEVQSGGLFPGGTRVERETRTRGVAGFSVDAAVVEGPASLSGEWTGLRSGDLEWEELGLGASVLVDGVTIGGSVGTRLGADRASWGGASATVPIGSSAALVLEGGRFPSDVLLERAGGRYLTVGLRLRS